MGVLNRENQAVQLGLVAAMLLSLASTGRYMRYVKPSMRPWILTAAAVLTLLAVTRAVEAARADHPDADTAADSRDGNDAHDAHGGGNLPWLLLLLVLAVILVAPGPLGAYTAARQTPRLPPPPTDTARFSPLPPPNNGAYQLTLDYFVYRALYDTEHQLAGRPIRLIGFVTPAPAGPDGIDFLLTRFVLSCCAADATPLQVGITGLPGPAPPPDTWVAVEGTWHPNPDQTDTAPVTLTATTLREIPQPTNPYED